MSVIQVTQEQWDSLCCAHVNAYYDYWYFALHSEHVYTWRRWRIQKRLARIQF